jgi:hypothetical protein
MTRHIAARHSTSLNWISEASGVVRNVISISIAQASRG